MLKYSGNENELHLSNNNIPCTYKLIDSTDGQKTVVPMQQLIFQLPY